MTIKKDNLTNIVVATCVLILIVFVFILFSNKTVITNSTSPVSYSGDSQILELTAKGGYSPNVITAKANVNTILNVITNKTFDCSSSIQIPKLNISKNLPLTGTTQIALGSYNAGEEVNGTCLMGMYSFKIKFI